MLGGAVLLVALCPTSALATPFHLFPIHCLGFGLSLFRCREVCTPLSISIVAFTCLTVIASSISGISILWAVWRDMSLFIAVEASLVLVIVVLELPRERYRSIRDRTRVTVCVSHI
jgi:hypothetical protein